LHSSSDTLATPLTMRLRAHTRALHQRAERSGVMADLLAHRIGRDAYVALLLNLRSLYVAIESALDRECALLTRLGASLPRLARADALDADLQAFSAAADSAPAARAHATAEYVARVDALRAGHAHRLLAHAYVRYLGDLHGGQILSRLVRNHFQLAAGAGTRFYDFGDDARVSALRQLLRSQLDAACLDALQADDVVEEAVWAFEAHCRLFEQLQTGSATRG
jgi:heme oxygenase